MRIHQMPASRSDIPMNLPHQWLRQLAALSVITAAFALRVEFLGQFNFHIDEFYTLAAAKFIAQSGAPRYPTGLFYDPGLPYTYLIGGLFRLFDYSEALARWPAVIFGALAVATLIRLGRVALRSAGVGLLAGLWLALSLESVEWGGRARMISLAQWLALVSVLLLWLGLMRNSARARWGFAAGYGLTLFSHFSTVVLLPAWGAAAGVLWWLKAIRLRWSLVRDGLLALAVAGFALSSGVIFQPPPGPDFELGATNLGNKTGALTEKFLEFPPDLPHAADAYLPWFIALPHGPLLALAALGIAASLWRALKKRPRRRDIGALYLAAIFVTVMLVLVLVISPHWQRSRYLLMQVQGVYLLLAAHGGRELLALVAPRLKNRALRTALVAATVIALTAPFVAALDSVLTAGSNGWLRYDLAAGFIAKNKSDADKIITMAAPAALFYLDQNDYYLVQSSPKLITRPDGQPGDRYSGALWLDSAGQLSPLLAGPDKIWLLVEEFWLFNSYDGYLQQQILFQMDKLWGEGGVWAMASRPGAWPLAREMETPVPAEFVDGTRLLGYSAEPLPPVPGGTLYLTLFWQAGQIPFGAKVFVHLRDEQNNTISQADHFIYDGKVPGSRWSDLSENDSAVRDGAALAVPFDLTPGRYRLIIGFYHPETFERLPVVNDQSGENGVILSEWQVP
ncbi:MAG: hypothetical protein Kow0031_08230 [Anaerolineae bacterium]